MLVRLGLVEQRDKAVLEVFGGATITDVALRYWVTRQTVHRWLRSYAGRSPVSSIIPPGRGAAPTRCPLRSKPASSP